MAKICVYKILYAISAGFLHRCQITMDKNGNEIFNFSRFLFHKVFSDQKKSEIFDGFFHSLFLEFKIDFQKL